MSKLLLDARLSQASYDAAYRNGSGGASIGGWQPIKVGEYRPITANFSAQLFRGADGSYKLAFRGTANPVGDGGHGSVAWSGISSRTCWWRVSSITTCCPKSA